MILLRAISNTWDGKSATDEPIGCLSLVAIFAVGTYAHERSVRDGIATVL